MSEETKTKKAEWAAIILASLFVLAPLAAYQIQSLIQQNWNVADSDRQVPWHSYEWATLAVLISQAWIYHKQRGLMNKQASIASQQIDSIERLERPLILPLSHLGHVDYRNSADKTTFPKVDMDFENYGRSPAFVDRWHVAMVVSIDPPNRKPSGRGYFSTIVRGTPFVDGITQVTGHNISYYMMILPGSPSIGPSERYGRSDVGGLKLNTQQIADVAAGTAEYMD